jgi:hypothetical protein
MTNDDERYPINSFRLCIEGVDGDIYGEIHSPAIKDPIPYSGVADILLKMDKLFDKMGYPQAFQRRRSFRDQSKENSYKGIPKPVHTGGEVRAFRGKIGTYDIRVDSRRDSNWQGVVLNVDHELVGRFQGEMDLVEILGNVK